MKYVVKDKKRIISREDINETTLEIKESSQGRWGIFSGNAQLNGESGNNMEFISENDAERWLEKNYKVIKRL